MVTLFAPHLNNMHVCPRSLSPACALYAQVSDGPPDVWLQLLQHCADSGKCGALIARGLGQRLADQQHQLAAQHEQLHAADARAAALEGRVQSLQSQVQQLLAHMQRVPVLLQQGGADKGWAVTAAVSRLHAAHGWWVAP